MSCGSSLPGVKVAIVDEADRWLPERCIGEIIVRSPRLLIGYYSWPDLTDRVLRNGWFHTGDIGYLADGQLYLCDRKKDVIIAGGRNLYAVALESTTENILRDVGGRAVAFGLSDTILGTELPVIVAEVNRDLDRSQRVHLIRRVRSQILREHNVAPADVRLVDLDWIVTTPKLSRAANRKKYLDSGFCPSVAQLQNIAIDNQSIAESPMVYSRADLERFVTELFESALGVHPIERADNFFDLEGDSLIFVNLLVILEDRLGRSLPIDELAEHPTIAGMVEALDRTSPTPLPSVRAYNERLNPLPVIKQVLTDPNLPLAVKGRRLRELTNALPAETSAYRERVFVDEV